MSNLSRPWIDFDEVSLASLLLKHEIKSMHARETKSPDHFFGSNRHFSVLDQAHYGSVSGSTYLVDHFKVKSRQNLPVPASHGAGGFLPFNKGLGIDHELLAANRRRNQRQVVIEEGVLGRAQQPWRSLQRSKSALCFLHRADNSHAVPAGSAIRFQHCWESVLDDPILQSIETFDHARFRDANAFLLRQFHKGSPGIAGRKAFRGSQRPFDQRTNRRTRFPLVALTVVETMQVPSRKIVSGNNQVRLGIGNGRAQRAQWSQPVEAMDLARHSRLGQRMPTRANHVHREPCIGQGHREAGSRVPAEGCGD